MKILFNTLVIVAAAGIGLAVGFALKGRSRNASHLTETADVAPGPTARSSTLSRATSFRPLNATNVLSKDDSPLATKLERDVSMSSGVTRWLYWLEAIEKATPADFPRLARLAQGNSTITRLLAARWVELDPRHMFDTIVTWRKGQSGLSTAELTGVLFQEWPKRDTEAVIAALSEPDQFGFRRDWRISVAMTVFERDVERGLRLFAQWNIENYGPRMTAVAKWAAADPRHAAEFALANPAGTASRFVMEALGKEWAKTEPARALEFALATRGELGNALATAALKEWSARSLPEAGEWLVSLDPAARNRLSPTLVEVWAKEDAHGALKWCEENLTGSTLAQAVGGVLKGAAAKDVTAAAGLVSAMQPSPARAEAALAVAEKWFPNSMSGKPVPPETIAWLAGLDGASLKRVLDRTYWRWGDSDPKGMAAFLALVNSDDVPPHVYSSLARNMARKNPPEALEWASHLPENRRVTTGNDAFSEWQRSQPESAMKWLNELPPNDARRQPLFQNAIQALAHSPHGAEQLAALTPPDRAAARSVIETMPLPEDHRSKLLDVLKAR